MKPINYVIVVILSVWIAQVAQPAVPEIPGDEPVVTSDLLRIRTISSIDVADDGTKAVFTLQSIAEKDDSDGYRYLSHLYLLDLVNPTAQPVQLTFGSRNDGSPAFSTDGRKIAFVRSATEGEGKSKSQIWVLPLEGGEARPVTDFKYGAYSPVWSPFGSKLLVISSIPIAEMKGNPPWPLERPNRDWNDAGISDNEDDLTVTPKPDGSREEIRAWLNANSEKNNPNVINRVRFQGENNLQDGFNFTQLFIVDTHSTDAVSQADALQLTNDYHNHGQARFMPNDQDIVYVTRKHTDKHPDRIRGSDIWMVGTDGENNRLFYSQDEWSVSSPKPSLDGSVIAFTASKLSDTMYSQSQIGMIGARANNETEPLWLTDSLDRSVYSFKWMSARGSILFNTGSEGAIPLLTISTALLKPAPVVDDPSVGVYTFDVGGGTIVYTETSPSNPCVLRVQTPRDGNRIAFNPNEWVLEKTLSVPIEGWLERPDGTQVQYWIMKPTNIEEGETYPLVLNIHGGPSAMWGPGERSMWHEFQLMCSWGYGIVFCNPRGSGGYGLEFQRANHQNWGDGPGGDVLAASDRALQEDWVDSDRLVVTGGSYAGYLTAWLVAHDHRFKAAVAQRGVYDLTTFFGEGNAWMLVEWAMGGFPWESNIRPILQRESPFYHVRQIKTPLLIMHASKDLRTGVSQSEMLYRALKVLHRPVEYIRYPNTGHELSRSGDPVQRMDRLNRIIEFFERHIENKRPAPVIKDDEAHVLVEEVVLETENNSD